LPHEFDTVIRAGSVADGSGGPLFEADVAIRSGRIAAVGRVAGSGREEIDARGLLVTPGFIDVHTHYDGQLTWSDQLSPSSSHGVTTVVTGNCGVGFAPCAQRDREILVQLMEGVEDIPEAVMAEGLPWNWESFPDFLDAVERQPHDIDFGVLLPHSPLRVAVMGERAVRLEPATAADRARMRQLAAEAMRAGAAGFGTSRNVFHQTSTGAQIPSMTAEEAELREIALGLADAGRGAMQAIAIAEAPSVADFELFHRVAAASGRPVSYTLLQSDAQPDLWREVLEAMGRANAQGPSVKAQVFNRPVGLILGLETSFNPFSMHPVYVERLAGLPLAERVAALRRPQVREALFQGAGTHAHPLGKSARAFDQTYGLGDPADYEPDPARSVAALAQARGVTPDEVALDLMLADGGHGKLMVAWANFADRSLAPCLEMMRREDTVLALGDGGAHYGTICDASYTTFTLTHWVRDRRGERLGLAEAVRMLTDQPARLQGFKDRGRLARGMKADLNVIDFDRLTLPAPRVVRDLPGGGKRLSQGAEGYMATYVAGTCIRREGADTGARPGRLVRDAGG
jgi:N-acyl-D-amino-acid deacylase